MNSIFPKFSMNFYKNNQNSAIVKLSRYKNATTDPQQITQSSTQVIQSIGNGTQFYTHLFKDLKDLSPKLQKGRCKIAPGESKQGPVLEWLLLSAH